MNPTTSDSLRAARERLTSFLARVQPSKGCATGLTTREINRLFSQLLSDLRNTERLLQQKEVSEQDTDLKDEIACYRGTLLRLQEAMPHLYALLMMERVRLESEGVRLRKASAWADASKITV